MLEVGGIFGSRCVGCRRRGPLLCDSCLRSTASSGELKRPAHVARLLCPWSYDGAIRSLILRLKVRGADDAASPLAGGMVAAARRMGLRATTVTWVPGRGPDIRRRGFDHAEVLARLVARDLGFGCVGLLERHGLQEDQTHLSASERARNLRGAFAARLGPPEVVLVDDVMTTGSTLTSCALALRDSGVRSVEGLVAAAA